MSDAVETYLRSIGKEYDTGKATEHSYRPALKTFVESLNAGISATNEPKREECGAPDFIVQKKHLPIGYIECKDIKWPLDSTEKTEQIKRYRCSLNNLILTNHLEFRYYQQGELRLTVPVARLENDKIKKIADSEDDLISLFNAFFAFKGPTIRSPKDLADRMAKLAQLIRYTIGESFKKESESGILHRQFDGFKKVLLNNLSEEQFADMYAQTISYGLFAARCNVTGKDADRFNREHAAFDLPKTNPFLREIFGQIAGPGLDNSIAWVVDDLAELLRKADIDTILLDFGRSTLQEDPVVHFYETFLAQYDSKMRQSRGVYYTPEPVVSYIVRSIDHILKTDFGLKDGLADASIIKHEFDNPQTGKKEKRKVHKVQILDPAVGTGTFLHGVINHIHDSFAGNKGMWSGYVEKHLLPRMYGFELLMAPYAVAHMKLGLLLKETGYDFKSDERLNVFLTNTLERAHDYVEELFANQLAQEANRASEIKKEVPVMVVLGNPPYSAVSENKGKWMYDKVRESYYPNDEIKEHNPKLLLDDYVKFIRFAQLRIEQTGYGILAFISNHGYLDNPTFRQMRQNLMDTFDESFIIDLHGNVKKREICPDGSKDENVFDIQQGVSIGIFVKKSTSGNSLSKIHHTDCYGLRKHKYLWLSENDIKTTKWKKVKPRKPFFLFKPFDTKKIREYESYKKAPEIFPVNSTGIKTHRDHFAIDFDENVLESRIKDFRDLKLEDGYIRDLYNLRDTRDWKMSNCREKLSQFNDWKQSLLSYLYRPFDLRSIYYHSCVVELTRPEVMHHILTGKENFCLGLGRQGLAVNEPQWTLVSVSRFLIDVNIFRRGGINLFPLYLYPEPNANGDLFANGFARHVNLDPVFIEEFSKKLKLEFVPDGKGNLKKTFGPEDIFNYMYAVFHSPTYRTRYAEFLKIDFPRLPLTSDNKLFRKLCALGGELVGLHLMESVPEPFTNYPVEGNHEVEKPIYVELKKGKDAHDGRVYINKTQYFENVPLEVWEFHIGGYQVCHKWLKDRKGRELTYDDINHYRNIVVVLSETMRLMAEVDKTISKWPIK